MTATSAARLEEIRRGLATARAEHEDLITPVWLDVVSELLAEVHRRTPSNLRVIEIGSGVVDVPIVAGNDGREIGTVPVPFVVKAQILPFRIGPFEVDEDSDLARGFGG